MENNFTKKPSKFYNISAHGLNYGPEHFFKLPKNVVVIMPSTRQSLSSCLITEGVMWQMNLLKPDETLLNIKDRIDAYKRNHKKLYDKPVDFKVYDSRTKNEIYMPNILYEKDENNDLFSGIVQCPLKIKLEYLKDDNFVLPTSTEVLVNQQNIIHNNNPEYKDKKKSRLPVHFNKLVKKNRGDIESVTNDYVITKLEECIQENLGNFSVTSYNFCGDNPTPGYNYLNSASTYKDKTNIRNPIIPLLFPCTKVQSSKTFSIDGEDKYELIEDFAWLSEIITKYRNSENTDTVLYFFSFACNNIYDSLKTLTSKEDLEEAYIKRDTDGMLIDDYMTLQSNFDIKSIEEQENQDIRKNISDMYDLDNIDEFKKYIQKNKLNILRLEQIRETVWNDDIKKYITEIIKFEKKNDIQNILDTIHTVNTTLTLSINEPCNVTPTKIKDLIKDLIKDCTIDKINKITDKIKNDETFLIKHLVLSVLNEKKQNEIIEQLKEIGERLSTINSSSRNSIHPEVLKDIEEALNNCSKDDIKIIKDTIEKLGYQIILDAVKRKEKEIEEKEEEIKNTEYNTQLTLLRFKTIDELLTKKKINNPKIYDELNTRKNIDEIEQIPTKINDLRLTELLSAIKENVDNLQTYDELLNMKKKIDNTFIFKNLILNYMENKETEFVRKMMEKGLITNKYLKYKKKYINLKKIIAINK